MSVVSQYCSIRVRSRSRHPVRSALHEGSLAMLRMRSPSDFASGIALGSAATARVPPHARAINKTAVIRAVFGDKLQLQGQDLAATERPWFWRTTLIVTDPRL